MKHKTEIFSIYGQIESVVADAMTREGKVNRIAFDMMPPTQQYDKHGRRAHCALVLTRKAAIEFNRRVRELWE